MITTYQVIIYTWDKERERYEPIVKQFKTEAVARRCFESMVVSADTPQIDLQKTEGTYKDGFSTEIIDRKD